MLHPAELSNFFFVIYCIVVSKLRKVQERHAAKGCHCDVLFICLCNCHLFYRDFSVTGSKAQVRSSVPWMRQRARFFPTCLLLRVSSQSFFDAAILKIWTWPWPPDSSYLTVASWLLLPDYLLFLPDYLLTPPTWLLLPDYLLTPPTWLPPFPTWLWRLSAWGLAVPSSRRRLPGWTLLSRPPRQSCTRSGSPPPGWPQSGLEKVNHMREKNVIRRRHILSPAPYGTASIPFSMNSHLFKKKLLTS